MFKHSKTVGRVLQVLIVLALTASAAGKLSGKMGEGFTHFGFEAGAATTIGIIELLCMLAFAIPQTSFIGAILISAYFGGATVTHMRIGEAPTAPIVLGIVAWVAWGLVNEDAMRAALGMAPRASK